MKHLEQFENKSIERKLNPSTLKLYDAAHQNTDFITEILDADPKDRVMFNKPAPGDAGQIHKKLVATTYYGWLLGKYGSEWESNM